MAAAIVSLGWSAAAPPADPGGDTHVSSDGQRFVGVVRPDAATLRLFSLGRPRLSAAAVAGVVRVLRWSRDDGGGGGVGRLLVLHRSGQLRIVTVVQSESSVEARFSHAIPPLLPGGGGGEEEVGEALLYQHPVCVLSLEQGATVAFYHAEQRRVTRRMALPPGERPRQLRAHRRHGLFVLGESSAYILSLDDTVTQINLRAIVKKVFRADVMQLQPWQLCPSENGKRLVIAFRCGSVLLLQVEHLKGMNNTYVSTYRTDSFTASARLSGTCNHPYNTNAEETTWFNRLRKSQKKLVARKCAKLLYSSFRSELNEGKNICFQHLTEDALYTMTKDVGSAHKNQSKIQVVNFSSGLKLCSGQLNDEARLVEGSFLSHPLLVINQHRTDVLIEAPAMHHEDVQEMVINKLVQYGDTTVADQFSTLNDWQSVHLPIQLLSLGLKNRLIDTVAFYLKTTCSALECSIFAATFPTEIQLLGITKGMEELKECIALVSSTIRDDMLERAPMIFSRQLALILTKYLTNLLIKLSHLSPRKRISDRMELNQFATECMQCLLRLHEQNLLLTNQAHCKENRVASFKTTEKDVPTTSQNRLATPTKMILDAVLKRFIPACQSRMTQGCLDANVNDDMWMNVYRIGLKQVLDGLEEQNLDKACCILRNMGMNLRSSLFNVLKHSTNKKIQTFLQPLMASWGALSAEDGASLNLLGHIQCMYPCESFEAAAASVHLGKRRPWVSKTVQHLSNLKLAGAKETRFLAFLKLAEPRADVSQKQSAYSNVTLNWVKQMDTGLVRLLAIDGLPQEKHLQIDNQGLPYLLIYENCQSIIDKLSKVTQARKNVTSIIESADNEFVLYEIEINLPKLSSAGSVKEIKPDRLSSQPGSALAPTAMPSSAALMFAIHHPNLCSELGSVPVLAPDWSTVKREKWFLFMKEIKALLQIAPGKSLFQASLSNLHYLQPRQQFPHLPDFLHNSCVIGGLATSFCIPSKILRVKKREKVMAAKKAFRHEAVVAKHVEQFPILKRSLSPCAVHVKNEETDVFNVLQCNASVRMQQWVQRHLGSTQEPLDLSTYPHFSYEPVMKLTGHRLHLDFMYYLRLGRPAYAFIKFITQETCLKSTIVKRRIHAACLKAAQIATKHFHDTSIACACVVFHELLRQDSKQLRMEIAIQKFKSLKELQSSNASLSSPLTVNSRVQKSASQPKSSSNRCSLHKIFEWKTVHTANQAMRSKDASAFLIQLAAAMDFITFTLFAQFYGLSKTQILPLLNNFPNSTVRDHLRNALLHHLYKKSHFLKQHENDAFIPTRNTRYCLYDKIGLTTKTKKILQEKAMGNEQELRIKDDASDSPSESTQDTIRREVASEDILGLLIKSEEMSSIRYLLLPTLLLRNPLLPVLTSSCLETNMSGSALSESLCVWLIVSADDTVSKFLVNEMKSALGTQTWIQDDITSIMQTVLESRNCSYVSQGLQIFHRQCLLGILMQFVALFFENHNSEGCSQQFTMFLQQFAQVKESASASDTCRDDYESIKKISHDILWKSLKLCSQPSQLVAMLTLFNQENARGIFNTLTVSDFEKALRGLCPLNDSIVHLSSRKFVKFADAPPSLTVLNRQILQDLIQHDQYDTLGKLVQTDSATATLARLQERCRRTASSLKHCVRKIFSQKQRLKMWMQCHLKIQRQCVPWEASARFFLNQVKHAQNHCEHFCLLHLALRYWPDEEDAKCNALSKLDVELEMWQHRIQLELAREESGELLDQLLQESYAASISLKLKADVQQQAKAFSNSPNKSVPMSKENAIILNGLIRKQLDANQLAKAWHLAHIFHHKEKNLNIILTCMDLAEGNVPLNEVHLQIDSKLHEKAKCKSDEEAVIMGLESLNCQCQHGKNLCNAFLIYYKIAAHLGLSYTQVVQHYDANGIVKLLLNSPLSNKFNLARDLLRNNAIPQTELFCIFFEVLKGSVKESAYDEQHPSNPLDQDELFSQLLSLCSDSASLGYQFLQACEASKPFPASQQALSLLVNLLLRANEYFSLACNTEGITSTLQTAKALIVHLAKEMHFALMVKLFVDIGRYRDMQYVFELLREHKQLDLLLKKDFNKNSGLKQALVEFINSNQLGNTEWFTMIALRFKLHRELAKMLRASAVHKLAAVSLSNPGKTKSTQDKLQDIQEDFAEAAKHYLQAECYGQANSCVQKAQLVALQINWLPTGRTILNMAENQATEFITNHPNFLETFVVARAYSVQVWPYALYANVVVRGNFDYLRDFHHHIGISNHLLDNIAYRFQRESAPPSATLRRNLNSLFQWSRSNAGY